MDNKNLVFGHKKPDTDSIASAISMANLQTNIGNYSESFRLGNVNRETEFALKTFSVKEPEYIEKVDENDDVIMVDSNEFPQSAEGIEKANIKMIVDHHRLNLQTANPVFCMAEPVGCTSTILYKLYKQNEVKIAPEMAGLMLSAIVSDTLLFKSPTCTKYDIRAVEELAKISGINNFETYGMDMLKAGTDLDDLTEKELINLDAKSLDKNGFKYKIAQVNTVDISNVVKRQINLEKEMQEEIKNDGLNLFVFAITDIVNGNSEIIALGNRIDIIEKSCNLVNNRAFLEGVVSRKKQLLPMIDNNI